MVERVRHPPQSSGGLAHPSQVVQKCFHCSACHSAKRLPLLAATLAFFQQEQIRRKPSEFIQHLRTGRVVTTRASALSDQTSAGAHSHAVNLRCGGRSGVQPTLNTELQARNTQGICKLFTEVQRDT